MFNKATYQELLQADVPAAPAPEPLAGPPVSPTAETKQELKYLKEATQELKQEFKRLKWTLLIGFTTVLILPDGSIGLALATVLAQFF